MKTLVITGGSKGIGLATARLFAAEGYRVVNISRSPIPLAGAVQLDIDIAQTDWAARHGEAVRAAVAGSATIALVHNAGLLTKDSVASVEAAALHRSLQVNVVACVQLDQLLLPLMGAGSSIVYVGSTLGEKAVAGSCAYVVSKHAQIGLMRATCRTSPGAASTPPACVPGSPIPRCCAPTSVTPPRCWRRWPAA